MRDSSGALRSRPRLMVLCGPTGSGKTALLHALQRNGAQTLDLEALARHRGSAFGALNEVQPTQSHFTRALARTLAGADPSRTLWVEHEAPYIGSLWLPPELIESLSESAAVVLSVPREHRGARILAEYGELPREVLLAGVARLAPKLGAVRVEELQRLIEAGRLAPAVELLLEHYDALYAHRLANRTGPVAMTLASDTRSTDDVAAWLIRENSAVNPADSKARPAP